MPRPVVANQGHVQQFVQAASALQTPHAVNAIATNHVTSAEIQNQLALGAISVDDIRAAKGV